MRPDTEVAPSPKFDRLYETPLISLATEFRQQVFIFDNNTLSKMRNPPRDGKNLGDILDAIQAPSRPREGVILMPAIAEANYRRRGGITTHELVQVHKEWSNEHFARYGITEIWLFGDRQGFVPFKALLEVLFRVLGNYWILCKAQAALKRYSRIEKRYDALNWYFDAIAELGQMPSTRFPFLAAASAIIGNTHGRGALNIRDGTPEKLLNGSWDLMYWDYFVQVFMKSDKTGQIPRFFSYDEDAVGMFSNIEPRENGALYFSYGLDRPSERENQRLQERVRELAAAPSRLDSFVEGVHLSIPLAQHTPEYLRLRQLLTECISQCPSLGDIWLNGFVERRYGKK